MRSNAMQPRTGGQECRWVRERNIEKSEPRRMRANRRDWSGQRNLIATVVLDLEGRSRYCIQVQKADFLASSF